MSTSISTPTSSSSTRLKRILGHLNNNNDSNLISKLLDVIENNIIPLTENGVSNGNKIFGGAILKNNGDVIICGTNKETECPLYHGEISTIKNYYDSKLNYNFNNNECIFLSTHEPCSMCLSAITWSGFKKIYYFFGYDMTTNNFNIPHDINILKQVFNKKGKNENYYNKHNQYFNSFHILDIIENIKDNNNNKETRRQLMNRVNNIKKKYDNLSIKYQNSKSTNNIPLN